MKLTCLSLITGFFVTTVSYAQTFQTAFNDKDGVRWSEELPGRHTNGCVGPDGTLNEIFCSKRIYTGKDSAAQGECLKVGARLATLKEMQALITNFDFESSDGALVKLTAKGRKQYLEAFHTTSRESFPSSTLISNGLIQKIFSPMNGFAQNWRRVRPDNKTAVRCVINPRDEARQSLNLDPDFTVDFNINSSFDHVLATLADGSMLTVGAFGKETKSEIPLLLQKRLSNGSIESSFKPDPIPYYTNPSWASWHKLSSGLGLSDGSALIVGFSGYNGSGAFRFSHIRKISASGKIDRKFGKNGVVAFEYNKLNYRSAGSLVEQADGKILGVEARCVSEGNSNFGSCERYLFRLLTNGQFDKSFGSDGFVQVHQLQYETFTYRILLSPNIYGVILFDGNRVQVAHYDKNGKIDTTFGNQGWKTLNMDLNSCSIKQLKSAGSQIAIATDCPLLKSFRIGKFSIDGMPVFPVQELLWPEIAPTFKVGGVGLTPLKNGELFLSYAVEFNDSNNQYNRYIDSVHGQIIQRNGEINTTWGNFQYYAEDDFSLFTWPTEIYSSQDLTGRVLLNIYDSSFYKGGLYLRTIPIVDSKY